MILEKKEKEKENILDSWISNF